MKKSFDDNYKDIEEKFNKKDITQSSTKPLKDIEEKVKKLKYHMIYGKH